MFREGQLKRFLYSLKKDKLLDDNTYDLISPSGSVPSRIYGSPKMHKVKGSNSIPPLRPIVSSIGAYNYKLAKYLSTKLTPLITTTHCAKDSFSVVEELKQLNYPVYDIQRQHAFVDMTRQMESLVSLKGPVWQIMNDHNFREIFTEQPNLKGLQGPIYDRDGVKHHFKEVFHAITELKSLQGKLY